MKKKIFFNLFFLSVFISIFLISSLMFTFYGLYVNKERDYLQNFAISLESIISNLDYDESLNTLDSIDWKGRISLIDLEGNVLFDNRKDISLMDNHLDRPEIKEAIVNGSASSVRYSTTLNTNTFYYSILVKNNDFILRVSSETNNLFSVFSKIIPNITFLFFLILVSSAFSSKYLSKKILEPLEDLSLNIEELIDNQELDRISIYDELIPFIQRFKRQDSEIKSNIRLLDEKLAILDTISSSMREGFLLIDSNKSILSINEGAIDLLKAQYKKSFIKENFINLCRNNQLNKTLDQCILSKNSQELFLSINEKFLNIYINPVLDRDSKKIIGLVLFILDYTEKYKLETMRRDFSSNVSHELKTPLTSINGYAELLENNLVKEEDVKKFASIIKKEGNRLLNLIDSIMKLSRIEEASEKKFEKISLLNISLGIIDSLDLLCKGKNIDIIFNGLDIHVMGNKSMLEDLIYNLLENSIKYSYENSKVEFTIEDSNNQVSLIFTDYGIGIPKEYQDRIFERFFMVDKSRTKNTNSTGLGLSIVKHIVEYHDGKIVLDSQLGKGTTIVVTLDKNTF